jgi:VCBS repeat-containing protein
MSSARAVVLQRRRANRERDDSAMVTSAGGSRMDNGRHIGRIGALAVALGIGSALASSPAAAWADSETSSESQSASSDAGEPKGKTTKTASTRENSDEPENGAREPDDAEDVEPENKADETDDPDDEGGSDRNAAEADSIEVEDDAPLRATVTRKLTVVTPIAPEPETPSQAPVLLSLLAATPRRTSDEDSFASAVPNTAPTIASAKAGAPSLFSSRITGRVRITDADRDKLTFTALTPEHGTVTVTSNGSFTYIPTTAFRHSIAGVPNTIFFDRVTITASDGNGGAVTAYFDLPVRPLNARPSARATVGKPNPANGAVTGKITVTDDDGDTVTFAGPGTTDRGAVVVAPDGTFVYTPTAESRQAATSLFKRSDRFTITVNDGHGGLRTVTVSVKIAPPGANKAPAVSNPGFVLNGFGDADGLVEGYVEVRDPEGFALTYGLGSGVAANVGTVTVDAGTGRFVFIPTQAARESAHGTPGEDTVRFTVTASDGAAVASVEVTVPISPKAPAATDTLKSGQWLEVGKYLQSANGRYRLYMQGDGNLVLYDEAQNHKALWASGTNGRPGAAAVMQGDGNLVVYQGSTGVWSSKTNGWNGGQLSLQSDGNLVIYVGGTAVWDRHAGVLRNPPTSGGTGTFAQKVAAFVSSNYGKTLSNAEGQYPGECVSLVVQFLKQVHGITAIKWGNAVDWRSGSGGGARMAASGFVWRTDQSFQNGDILVWGQGTYTKPEGHIGVWNAGKVFDSNSGWHRDVASNQAGYSQFFSQGYLGYWRKP